MINDAQFAAWLGDASAQRVTLFEVGVNSASAEITRYLSNKAYGGGSSGTPYLAIVAGGLKMTESISLVSQAGLSAGDIELVNLGGERDAWLDDIWVNHPFQAWVGDVRWPREDFRQIYNGIVADIDGTKTRDRINLRLRDKLQRLNTPVSEAHIGGAAPNPDVLRPIVLGEVHNITPKLKNPATGEYEFNAGASEELIEVRTDGKPRQVTKNLAAGSFTFVGAVGPGAVTCSAQGVKPAGTYGNSAAKLVKYLVTQCGKASDRFTDADIDLVNFAAFDAAHPQALGMYLPERINVIEACHQLASSVGAQLVLTRAGKLRLVRIAFPSETATEIRPNVQLDRSIQLVAQTDVVGAANVGYCRNWSVQANLQTSLPVAHKELFGDEWLNVDARDETVLATYKLDGAAPQENTLLQDGADALAEAVRRRDLFKVKRRTYRFEGTPDNMALELGQAVKLFSNRYDLDAGKIGVVTSLAPDWDNFHVTVEVTI